MSYFKRKNKERKEETVKIVNVYDITKVTNKLGISSDAPREKIIFELNKLKNKRDLRNTLKLTDKDFKDYGIE